MIKGLEALERLVDGNLNEVNYYRQFCDSTTYIMKDKELIEKELKALDIIKTKKVNVMIFLGCDNLEEYNKHPLVWNYLTQEEYELVKEVLL